MSVYRVRAAYTNLELMIKTNFPPDLANSFDDAKKHALVREQSSVQGYSFRISRSWAANTVDRDNLPVRVQPELTADSTRKILREVNSQAKVWKSRWTLLFDKFDILSQSQMPAKSHSRVQRSASLNQQ